MRWKQMLAIGLSAVTMMSAVPGEGIHVHASTKTEVTKEAKETSEYGSEVDSGTISDETSGTEITWTVYDSGKLVIDGTGATPDWSPWFNYKEDITDVIIGNGTTVITVKSGSKTAKCKITVK